MPRRAPHLRCVAPRLHSDPAGPDGSLSVGLTAIKRSHLRAPRLQLGVCIRRVLTASETPPPPSAVTVAEIEGERRTDRHRFSQHDVSAWNSHTTFQALSRVFYAWRLLQGQANEMLLAINALKYLNMDIRFVLSTTYSLPSFWSTHKQCGLVRLV